MAIVLILASLIFGCLTRCTCCRYPSGLYVYKLRDMLQTAFVTPWCLYLRWVILYHTSRWYQCIYDRMKQRVLEQFLYEYLLLSASVSCLSSPYTNWFMRCMLDIQHTYPILPMLDPQSTFIKNTSMCKWYTELKS